jgi:Icc-related predicted phosphoesterase
LPDQEMTIAAVGDIHCGNDCQGTLRPMFEQASREADVFLLLGDLTKYGKVEECELLISELQPVLAIPVIAVFGNHDHESDQQDQIAEILGAAGVKVLDGTSTVVGNVGFAGVKGFAGGFGRRALTPWGEKPIKDFVQEGTSEAMKLERGLAELRTDYKVVLLHYSPVYATVRGEPEQIAPFMGSTRLEEPIDRYRADVVFHGHAHYGSPEGRTKSGIPVFNVAMPLLQKLAPERPPYKLYRVGREAAVPSS